MFSEYVIYIDESGDHGLDRINPQYPVFVLATCLFKKFEYRELVVPTFLELKHRFFGHDMVVLHTRDIRKATGPFCMLQNAETREKFFADLNGAMAAAPTTVVAAVIDKHRLRDRYLHPHNPYEVAMRFCLERAYGQLRSLKQDRLLTPVVVEQRGRKEDEELELSFLRIVQGDNQWNCRLPFSLIFADKKANSIGLQLADLIAHPIGRHHIKPDQPNRAYEIVRTKLRCNPKGGVEGWGLKIFPG